MNHQKGIGMDVYQTTVSVDVMDGIGKLIMERFYCSAHDLRQVL